MQSADTSKANRTVSRSCAKYFKICEVYLLGIAGGNFISMTVNAQIGTRRMYKIFGFIGIACAVLYYVIYHVLIKKAEVKTTKEESIDNIELNPVVNAKETVGL